MKWALIAAALGVLWAGTQEDAFIGARGRYWAFQKVVRPAVPPIAGNPIDAFILQTLRAKQLEPSKPLDRAQLLRRVPYDLTGLPPTPGELDSFLKDQTRDAYEKSSIDCSSRRITASAGHRSGWTWFGTRTRMVSSSTRTGRTRG